MSTSNRISTVIQSTGLIECRLSRSSCGHSSQSQEDDGDERKTGLTDEIAVPKRDGSDSNSVEDVRPDSETTHVSTIEIEKEQPSESESPNGAVIVHRRDRPILRSPPIDARMKPSPTSETSTSSTPRFFASPVPPSGPQYNLHPRYNSLASEEAAIGFESSDFVLSRDYSRSSRMYDSLTMASALRSHPINPSLIPRRSATVPTRRRASFYPALLDTDRGRWSGRDVPPTPYPATSVDDELDNIVVAPPPTAPPRPIPAPHDRTTGLATLFSRLRPQRNRLNKGPSSQAHSAAQQSSQTTKKTPTESHLTITIEDVATTNLRTSELYLPVCSDTGDAVQSDHDDEELAYRMRDAYLALRGPWKSLFLARGVTGVHLHPDADEHEYEGTVHGAQHLSSFTTESDGLCNDLLSLFHSPSSGHGSVRVLARVTAISSRRSEARRLDTSGMEAHARLRATIQLVEGWSVPRIALACGAVLMASVLAVVLWVMLGVGEQMRFEILNATAGAGGGDTPLRVVTESSKGLKELPADRVQAGAILGLLVLFLGWSWMGMWMFLSYLVC